MRSQVPLYAGIGLDWSVLALSNYTVEFSIQSHANINRKLHFLNYVVYWVAMKLMNTILL